MKVLKISEYSKLSSDAQFCVLERLGKNQFIRKVMRIKDLREFGIINLNSEGDKKILCEKIHHSLNTKEYIGICSFDEDLIHVSLVYYNWNFSTKKAKSKLYSTVEINRIEKCIALFEDSLLNFS